MSITATVEDDVIRLPAGVHFPNGTQVRVEPMPALSSTRLEGWLKGAVGVAGRGITTDEVMALTRGEA